MNLTEYAETSKASKKTRCMTCNLPAEVLSQVETARTQEPVVSFKIISRWLKDDQGIEILPATLRNHFIAGHDHD